MLTQKIPTSPSDEHDKLLLESVKAIYHEHFITQLHQSIKVITQDRANSFGNSCMVKIQPVKPDDNHWAHHINENWIKPLKEMDGWWYWWSQPYKQLSQHIKTLVTLHNQVMSSPSYDIFIAECVNIEENIAKDIQQFTNRPFTFWPFTSFFDQLKNKLLTTLQTKFSTDASIKSTLTKAHKTLTEHIKDYMDATASYGNKLKDIINKITKHHPDLKQPDNRPAQQSFLEHTIKELTHRLPISQIIHIVQETRDKNKNHLLTATDCFDILLKTTTINKTLVGTIPLAALNKLQASTHKNSLNALFTYLSTRHNRGHEQIAIKALQYLLNVEGRQTLKQLQNKSLKGNTLKKIIKNLPLAPLSNPPAALTDYVSTLTNIQTHSQPTKVKSNDDNNSQLDTHSNTSTTSAITLDSGASSTSTLSQRFFDLKGGSQQGQGALYSTLSSTNSR